MAPPAQAARITYLVKQLERAIRSEMDRQAAEVGLTALQYTALTVLQRHPGMSGAQLARRSFVTAQAGSEMIANLERKGLVTRTPDPRNRRILRVSLSPDGERVVDECSQWMDRIEKQMLADLTPRQADVFRKHLEGCIRALKPE